MLFSEISDLFLKLESTTKRINKILILKDFYETSSENKLIIPKLFDLICGNFQRKIGKTNLSISLKTIYLVIKFLSKVSEEKINKRFSKTGDIGEVASYFIDNKIQKSLNPKKITFEEVFSSLEKISRISGLNSNKQKVEILSNLLINLEDKNQIKFLVRILVSDLRIGTSIGTLIDTTLNIFLPHLKNFNFICENCGKMNLSNDNCFNCEEKISKKNCEEIYKKNNITFYKIDKVSDLKKLEKNEFVDFPIPREYYNFYSNLLEEKYNCINMFEELFFELEKDLSSIFKKELKYLRPIKSMLGTNLKNEEEIDKNVKYPIFSDYKYDGLRLQIHKKDNEVVVFSRNLENLSSQFLEVINFFKENFKENFILDSECIAYDYNNKKFLDFQTLSRRILSKNISEVSHIKLQVKIFDILKLNDKNLIDLEYSKRREIIEELLLNKDLEEF